MSRNLSERLYEDTLLPDFKGASNCTLKTPICPVSVQILRDMAVFSDRDGVQKRADQCSRAYEKYRHVTEKTDCFLFFENSRSYLTRFLLFLEHKQNLGNIYVGNRHKRLQYSACNS